MPDFDAPCIRIWHQDDMSQFVGRGPKIGFPIFELNKFNKKESYHLSNVDKLFVCSEWAKNIVVECRPIRPNGNLDTSNASTTFFFFFHRFYPFTASLSAAIIGFIRASCFTK